MHGWSDPIDQGRARWRPGYPPGASPYPPDPANAGPDPEFPESNFFADQPDDTQTADRGAPRDVSTGPGRHRTPQRSRKPLILALTVTGVLALFGAGATVLPPSLTGASDATSSAGRAGGEGGPDMLDGLPAPVTGALTPAATPTATASPSPTRTAPTTSAPTASPTRNRTPAPTRTTSKPATSSGTADSREAEVLAIVNRERASAGCGAVTSNSKLATAARLHSEDQAENTNMSHTGSDGSDFVERARQAGYTSPIGENVAMGYATAAAVMNGWMNSSGHRANILNCRAKAIGIGVAKGPDNRLYWTQVFGSTA